MPTVIFFNVVSYRETGHNTVNTYRYILNGTYGSAPSTMYEVLPLVFTDFVNTVCPCAGLSMLNTSTGRECCGSRPLSGTKDPDPTCEVPVPYHTYQVRYIVFSLKSEK
jgi:hypothetical protein